jgi:hypothetical protein
LIQSQMDIGRHQLFNGHLSPQWQLRQDLYIRCQGIHMCTNTGNGWMLQLITVLWTAFFDLWENSNIISID